MSAEDRPQITLITPPALDLDLFPTQLARVLDSTDIACLRLALATKDTDTLGRAADACREIAHARDVAIVIDTHLLLAERHGLDGVHLTTGAKQVRYARRELGDDAIVGCFSGASRHDGMSAAESGADYVSFGPVGPTGLGTGEEAPMDLFAWWSEMIEVPIVAEGGLDAVLIGKLAPITDFFAIGPEIWAKDDPMDALSHLWRQDK